MYSAAHSSTAPLNHAVQLDNNPDTQGTANMQLAPTQNVGLSGAYDQGALRQRDRSRAVHLVNMFKHIRSNPVPDRQFETRIRDIVLEAVAPRFQKGEIPSGEASLAYLYDTALAAVRNANLSRGELQKAEALCKQWYFPGGGKKSKIASKLPFEFNGFPGIGNAAFYTTVKPWLRETATKAAHDIALEHVNNVVELKAPEFPFHVRVQARLRNEVIANGALTPQQRKFAHAWIDQKWQMAQPAPCVMFENGSGIFFDTGTNLDAEVLRETNGQLYQIPNTSQQEEREVLRTTYNVNIPTPELGAGGRAKVVVARKLVGDDVELKAVKVYMPGENQGSQERRNLRAAKEREVSSRIYPGRYESARVGRRDLLIMDIAPADLLSVATAVRKIETSPKVRNSIKRRLAENIIRSVRDMHSMGFVHRDIKPENFVLDKNGNVFAADFETAAERGTDDQYYKDIDLRDSWVIRPMQYVEEEEVWKYVTTTEFDLPMEGTIGYVDPAVTHVTIAVPPPTLREVDAYALGVTLYILARGGVSQFLREPDVLEFKGFSTEDIQAKDDKGSTLLGVAMRLMHCDPSKRPALDDVLAMPYFTNPNCATDEQMTNLLATLDRR